MKNKILTILVVFFSRLLSLILKVDEKKILFGSMYGGYYGDNSMHLYEWILENREDLSPIWITKNPDIYCRLKDENKPVANAKKINGLIHLLTANVGAFSNSLNDLAWNYKVVPKSLALIALRHGRSVKKIRFARERHSLSQKELKERKFESKRLKYAISTSEFISELQEQCLRIGRDKHVVTGYPRNDELYAPSYNSKISWNTYTEGIDYDKAILYGPSWRHERYHTEFFPFADFNSYKLCSFLEEKKYLLLLRPHRNELIKYPELVEFLSDLSKKTKMIKLCSHEVFPDVNNALPFIDVLISDYSALYHDFLLLDRPMLFTPYDYEDFNRQNGFLYDYFKYLPGPNIESFEMFCQELENISNDVDNYKDKREILRNKIHTFQDAKSCKRVTKIIDRIIVNETE